MTARAALAVSAAVVLAATTGCAGTSTSQDVPGPTTTAAATTSSTTAAATPRPTEAVTAIDITIDGRDITPAPGRIKVPVDGKVRLTVTSDVDNELHIHGIDQYEDLVAGEPTTVTFRMPQSGLFELETHEDPVLLLAQLQVQ